MNKTDIINQINDQELSELILRRSELEEKLIKIISIHELYQSTSKEKGAFVRVYVRIRNLNISV